MNRLEMLKGNFWALLQMASNLVKCKLIYLPPKRKSKYGKKFNTDLYGLT